LHELIRQKFLFFCFFCFFFFFFLCLLAYSEIKNSILGLTLSNFFARFGFEGDGILRERLEGKNNTLMLMK